MARLLYFSTHEPLEYDDIQLFTSMGHSVFSLGVYCPANNTAPEYRPAIEWGDDVLDLRDRFESMGCRATFLNPVETDLTKEFVDLFDAIIVIQDVGFIHKFWPILKGRNVIWRTVGQAIDHCDIALRDHRAEGLKIVRWCNREVFADYYLGHDAIIRAYKDESQYDGWTGSDGRVVTFSNAYRDRYPIEYGMFERVTHLMPAAIGGGGNAELPNSIGLMSMDGMQATMRGAGAYFYMHGSVVPYTLNFIEAMMTGIPVVAAGRNVEIHNIDMRYNEINDFIMSGKNGFLFKSERQARGILMDLLLDKGRAAEVGRHGRETAIRLFGKQRATADWQTFFRSLGISE
jgi:hypothetical protein